MKINDIKVLKEGTLSIDVLNEDSSEAIQNALENWMEMESTPHDIQTILSSPESAPYKKPPNIKWLYRAIVPKDKDINSIKSTGQVVAFATDIQGAINFIRTLGIQDDWVIIRKTFNPSDFLLDFTGMYEAVAQGAHSDRYVKEHEVWMKPTPEYTTAKKNEIVYSSKEDDNGLTEHKSEFILAEGTLRIDVPNEDWLADKIAYAKKRGRDSFGVPYMGSTTAYVRQPSYVELPVDLLARIPGARGEQSNVRYDDLDAIMKIMKDTGKLPLTQTGNEYMPFITVAWDGSPWVSEGNHRIMAAKRLGWKTLPVELKYFDGGERIRSGVLYPGKIGLGDVKNSRETDENPLVVVYDKDGELHTHANLSVANNIFRTNVKPEDVFKGPVKVKSGGSYGEVTFALSKHHTSESVAEAFDKPYRSKTEKSESGSFDVLAKLPDGTNLSIMFNNEGNDEWQVEFYRNNSQEVTGEGDAQRIFATVLAAIQKFITKHKPANLTFAASKETDPTIYYEPGEPQPNPASRAKLYDRLVQRYAKSWGYRAFRADNGHVVMYELSRIKPMTATESTIVEGGWASIETQNTVITPKTVAEIIHILDGFEASYNAWQKGNELDTEIKIGKPKGSGTYYRRDLEQDPNREYGDVDVECFIHSRAGATSAQRITEYKRAIADYCLQSPDFSTENGTNIIMRTTDGPVQVDLIFTYHEHADWSRVLSPEYRVKGVISTSLTSSIAEALNLSFSSQGIQVKIRNNQPVSFRQSKDTELRTVSTSPETWAQDIYSLYYYLSHGEQPTTMPRELQAHGGLKDEQRLSDIVLSIKALASGLEESNLLGHGSLIDIHDKRDLIRRVAQIYSAKLEAAENSSKFDKASTPAAVEKAKKTKLMLARYRNEVTKLLLN